MIVAAIAVVATGWIALVLALCRAMAPKTAEERRFDDESQMAALAKYTRGLVAESPTPSTAEQAAGSGFHIAEGGGTTATRYGRRLVDPREGVGLAPQRADFGLARESATGYIEPDPCPPRGIARQRACPDPLCEDGEYKDDSMSVLGIPGGRVGYALCPTCEGGALRALPEEA